MWWHLHKNELVFISYTFFIKMRQLYLIFSKYFLFYFCTNEKIQLKYYFPSLFWSFQTDSIIKWTSHNKLLLIFAQWKALFPRRSSVILHAEKSAEAPACTQPVQEGQQSPDTLAEHLRLPLWRTHWAVWVAWSQNESLQEYPRRSGCSGGDLHKVLLIVCALVHSHCSCATHSSVRWVKGQAGTEITSWHRSQLCLGAAVSACCFEITWCFVMIPFGLIFPWVGLLGPPNLASCVSDIPKLCASTQPII